MSSPRLPFRGPRFDRLTASQCEQMQTASLWILEHIGVRLYAPEALSLLQEAGLQVEQDNRVRIPPDLVQEALSTAPSAVNIYDQEGQKAMQVQDNHVYFGTGSDTLHILDHRNGARRKPILQDVVEATRLSDALENIDFIMSMFLPTDVPSDRTDRFQMDAMLNNTHKPIVFVAYDLLGCKDVVQMAQAVAGGPQALREKPFIACYINVTTGLRHNEEALQKLLFLADQGVPALYIPGAQAGTAGPVTVAGSNAMRMAGALVGVVLAQLKRKGAPVFVPGWGALALNMRTTVQAYTGPDHQGVTQSMAHAWGLPMFAMAGATDSKLLDSQAGIEAALSLLFNAMAGSHLVHDIGYLESGLTGSLAQIVICDEILTWVKRSLRQVKVDDETLALRLVQEQGPDGQFLDSEHTLTHFREQWHPSLFDREHYAGWKAAGGTTLSQRARRKVELILERHTPVALDEKTRSELQRLLEGN